MSRLPIVATSNHRFRQSAGVEALVGKGALCVVVQSAAGGQVAVWNVHLQSGLEAGAVRREQIRELAAWIHEVPTAGCIVLGDFNCGPGAAEWEALVQAFDAPIDGAFVSDHFGQEVRLSATAFAAR